MSGQIKLKAATLGGDITLSPTDTASNLVVTIPAGTSTLGTNATLPAQLNATGSAPIYACRAWVNFNGTGTVAIRASGNVSSITDNGTGNYTVNFTTAMEDADYSAVCAVGTLTGGSSDEFPYVVNYTTSSVQVLVVRAAFIDASLVSVAIFR
jgi:hypothetical protein